MSARSVFLRPSAIHHITSAACSQCSSAAVFTRVSLVTLQSVHAALSLQKLQNCITVSSLQQPPSIIQSSGFLQMSDHTFVFNVDNLLLEIELSLRPMSRCLVNTAVMATPAIITTVSAAILGYIGIASLCSATKVNVLAPTLIGGGASILYPHSRPLLQRPVRHLAASCSSFPRR